MRWSRPSVNDRSEAVDFSSRQGWKVFASHGATVRALAGIVWLLGRLTQNEKAAMDPKILFRIDNGWFSAPRIYSGQE